MGATDTVACGSVGMLLDVPVSGGCGLPAPPLSARSRPPAIAAGGPIAGGTAVPLAGAAELGTRDAVAPGVLAVETSSCEALAGDGPGSVPGLSSISRTADKLWRRPPCNFIHETLTTLEHTNSNAANLVICEVDFTAGTGWCRWPRTCITLVFFMFCIME